MNNEIAIVVVDDFSIFRKGFCSLLEIAGYNVIGNYQNGLEFISNINDDKLPNFVFTEIEMPQMDGYATTSWLKENHPTINVLAMCVDYNEIAIKKMIKNGAKGFVSKTIESSEIKSAIKSVIKKGHYYPNIDNEFF